MTQFTKGPWKPDWKKPGVIRGIDAADGGSVIMADEYAGSAWIGVENLHDINLIATAPDLYEALDRLIGEIKDYHVSSSVLDAIELSISALAKARGEA